MFFAGVEDVGPLSLLSFLSPAHSLALFFGPLPVSPPVCLSGLILSARRIICREVGVGWV